MRELMGTTEWKPMDVLTLIFYTLVPGVLSGVGFFYIDALILENGLFRSLVFSLMISLSLTVVSTMHALSHIQLRFEERGEI